MSGNNGQAGRGVINKAVAVLEAFTPDRRELTLNQIAQITGLPISTAYRTAGELAGSGILERVDQGGYRIGLRLYELGSFAQRAVTMLSVVVPFMQDLYEVTHETVQLAVLDGDEALYIEKLYGSRSPNVRSVRGGRLPLHCTGTGKVLLAYAPPQLAQRLAAAGLRRFTPHTITDGQELNRALAEIRRSGVAFQREEIEPNRVSVAAPVRDSSDTVVAALSVVMRAGPNRLRQLAPAVRTAAVSASREMSEQGVRGISTESLLQLMYDGTHVNT
jgi:DNA-binding IclR family transcriptional regulator